MNSTSSRPVSQLTSILSPLALAIALSISLAGCKQPMAVTDPANGAVYYTQAIDREPDGSVQFYDAVTGAKRQIPGGTVSNISAEEFRRKVGYADDATRSSGMAGRRAVIERNPAPADPYP